MLGRKQEGYTLLIAAESAEQKRSHAKAGLGDTRGTCSALIKIEIAPSALVQCQ